MGRIARAVLRVQHRPRRRLYRTAMVAHLFSRRNRFPAACCLAGVMLALGAIALRAADDPAAGEKKPSSAIEIAAVTRAEPVDFGKDVLPILRQNCIACHNAKDQE